MDSLLKSFQCSFCSKQFTTDNGSDDHQRAVHSVKYSQSKPFACTVCPKRFTTDKDLKHHVKNASKRHKKMTGDISCSYPFCQRKFQSQNEFASSTLKHHLQNPGNWHERKGKGLFDRNCSSEEVNILIHDELQPDEGFHGLYEKAVDSLEKKLRKVLPNTFYGIHSFIEAGSIAKGTALKNDSDLNCVMITKNIKDASQLKAKLPDVLRDLKKRLGSSMGVRWKLTLKEKTPFSLLLNMSRHSNPKDTITVAVLPTFEANVEGEKFYKEMLRDTKENWPYYSAALVKVQRDFVKKRPASVKDLIRLVKYWRKTYIPQSGSKHVPPSYLLELLTIHAWENANPLNPPESFVMKIGFKAVMEVLKNHQSLRVHWENYYRRDLIPISLLNEAYIIDPANPTNNLYASVDCWDEVKKVAEETMRKPLLRDVRVTFNWG